MSKDYASLERKYWLQTKARGKRRLIWRELLFGLLLCLVLAAGVPVLTHSFSVRSVILRVVILLPVFLLGGYLTGSWKWKDLEKSIRRTASLP
jgi:Tfp pilus assembly protein PilN